MYDYSYLPFRQLEPWGKGMVPPASPRSSYLWLGRDSEILQLLTCSWPHTSVMAQDYVEHDGDDSAVSGSSTRRSSCEVRHDTHSSLSLEESGRRFSRFFAMTWKAESLGSAKTSTETIVCVPDSQHRSAVQKRVAADCRCMAVRKTLHTRHT